MLKKLLLALPVLFILFTNKATAQLPELRNFIDKITSYKNISYTSVTKNDGVFGDSADTIQSYQTSGVPLQNLKFELATARVRDVFDGTRLLSVNFSPKYYSTNSNFNYSGHYANSILLFKLTDLINATLKTPQKIRKLNDTIILANRCNHIQIWERDTLIGGKRSYTKYDVYLSKTTSLPLYAEVNMLGFIVKGDYASEDAIRVNNKNWYTNYVFNQPENSNRTSTVVPSGFMTLEDYNKSVSEIPKPTLALESMAPEWKLQNLNGKYLSSKDLKGKITIIDFWGNCGACILAVPTISRLHKRYEGSNVEVVSVCVDKGKEAAARFAKKLKLLYPVYINGKDLSTEFRIGPIPTFFIIDGEGKIVSVIEGFSDGLEKQLISEVEKLQR
jgi:thiol-disulfide isomerase/thioredoxin